MLWRCHFCNCSTTNISMGHLGENTSKWCWKTTSGCHPNITKRLYFFCLIWIPMPVAYLDFGKIEPAECLLVHTKHNSIQHTLNGKHLQIRIQNIRSRTTSISAGRYPEMLISGFQPRSLGQERETLHQCYRVQFRTRCNAWLAFVGSLLGSERIYFFLLVLHFASLAKNQPDLFR